MRLEIKSLWSPDCDASTELPADREDFEVLISVSLGEEGEEETELFYLTVCSPMRLARLTLGTFVSATLILERFDWAELRLRLEKLLRHAQSCDDWNQIVAALAPYLRYAD